MLCNRDIVKVRHVDGEPWTPDEIGRYLVDDEDGLTPPYHFELDDSGTLWVADHDMRMVEVGTYGQAEINVILEV